MTEQSNLTFSRENTFAQTAPPFADLREQHSKLNTIHDNDQSIIQFIDQLLKNAFENRASDIHFEVFSNHCRIRFRRDGLLHAVTQTSKMISTKLIARLKIMAKLDIAEKRLPQDGHFKLQITKTEGIDVRASSCPTIYGEKIVLRLLDQQQLLRDIHSIGFNAQQEQIFLQAIHKPQGLILVTGPTGSGKTTTLYSALAHLNQIEKNILTIEDPVEIHLAGINQVQINTKSGLTFPIALRSFLRQDPDIIMIGEIRDSETAEIAIKAAQTGHLVLSTLHTNSAKETLTRLKQMGVSEYDLSGSINLITAQRLLRKLCPHCKKPHRFKLKIAQQFELTNNDNLYESGKCKNCLNGYDGRLAIHELLTFKDNEIKNQGTLQEEAIDQIERGITSVEEVRRVVDI